MVMKLNLTNDNFVFGIISNIITSLFYIMKAESRKQKAESRKQKAESLFLIITQNNIYVKSLANFFVKRFLLQILSRTFGFLFIKKIIYYKEGQL